MTATEVQHDLAAGIRDKFPIFQHNTYVNSCSQGALSDSVRAAYDEYLQGLESEGSLWKEWVERLERLRSAMAELLNAPRTDVAITASASAGVNAVASGLDFNAGRHKIITTGLDFPTTGQIWRAQTSRGAEIVHVTAQANQTIPLSSFEQVLDDQTLLISLPMVCYRNGSTLDLKPIIDLAHARGVLVMADVYQGVGALHLDAAELGADFLVGGMLKYLLGSPGVGFLTARSESTAHIVPRQTGWFAAADIFAMDGEVFDPSVDARRFESGTPPVPSLYAATAGVELMQQIGVDRTQQHVAGLNDALRDGVQELGGRVVTPISGSGPMIAVAATDDEAYVEALAHERVVTSNRDGNVRISPHCYNNDRDVEAVLTALRKHRHLLR